MSNPLDDFNRRMTYGDSLGPAKNAAESAAQSFIDIQKRNSFSVGGGSIDFGAKISTVILATGIALFYFGVYLVENFQESPAMMGIIASLIGGFVILIGGGGLVVAGIKNIGNVASLLGTKNLLFAAAVGFIAYWISPAIWSLLWMIGLPMVPVWLIAFIAYCLLFMIIRRFFRFFQIIVQRK